MKQLMKKFFFPNTYSSEKYINYLRKKGMRIGNNTIVFSPNNTYIDEQRPYLISIGDNCKITRGVTILTHDYSRSVIRIVYGENIGEAKHTSIGNNVFIGNNSIILMGSSIGDNSIVAAGSVVTKQFPDNVVIGGNPAKILSTLEDYFFKRKNVVVEEAKLYATTLFKRKKQIPTIQEMGNAFAWLYLERTDDNIEKYHGFFNLSGDNKDDVIEKFKTTNPEFNSYKDFLIYCGLIKNE